MSTPSLLAREAEREEDPRSSYPILVLVIIAGLLAMGHGCTRFFGPEVHAAYFADPACDEALLLAAKEHLAPSCSIVRATLFDQKPDDDEVALSTLTLKGTPAWARLDAFDRGLNDIFRVKVSWDDAKKDQAYWIQVFHDAGPDGNQLYVVAKIFDPAAQRLIVTKDIPISKNRGAWREIGACAIIVAGASALLAFAIWVKNNVKPPRYS